MYKNDSSLSISKILFGIIFSLFIVILVRIGVFKDLYNVSASIFKDFQQQNMTFFGQIKQDFDFLTNLGNYKLQNEQLIADNTKLISENSDLRNQLNDYKLITSQMTFDPQYDYIPLRITKYKDSQTEVILNKGEGENIKIDDIIIFQKFLVGRVIEVNKSYSVAKLIIDSKNKIAAESQSSKLRGVCTGDGISGMLMEQVPNNKPLGMSELILTSGTDGIYPYGLIVGKVSKIESRATDIEQSAQIVPRQRIENAFGNRT
mgnify:CR=1 FL=1